jgi:predicted ATPase
VLDEFGRMGNIYCKSALGKIENRVKEHEIDPKLALDALRGGLDKLASGILANNEGFGKFTTINPKQKYIEFRTAGGEDYSEDITKLQNTLGRYAQAMYIASHPDMYRTEYQKKMYKLLSESEDSTDTIKELSKLSAGKASDQDIQTWYSHMKEVLKKSETKRVATKGNKLMVWSVSTKRNPHVSADVFAMSGDEAIEIARKYDKSWQKYEPRTFIAKPVRQATPEEVERYNSASDTESKTVVPRWEVYDKTTDKSVYIFDNPENNMTSARQIGQMWHSSRDIQIPRNQLGLRPVEQDQYTVQRPQQSDPRPVETEPQNFPAAGNTFTGQWKVVSAATGEVLYTFGGVGNSQGDANRVARGWAERTGFDDTIEVYPIMR